MSIFTAEARSSFRLLQPVPQPTPTSFPGELIDHDGACCDRASQIDMYAHADTLTAHLLLVVALTTLTIGRLGLSRACGGQPLRSIYFLAWWMTVALSLSASAQTTASSSGESTPAAATDVQRQLDLPAYCLN